MLVERPGMKAKRIRKKYHRFGCVQRGWQDIKSRGSFLHFYFFKKSHEDLKPEKSLNKSGCGERLGGGCGG